MNFKYRAESFDGVNVTGIIEAFDEFEAIDKIKQNCRLVTSIKEVDQKKSFADITIGTPKIKDKTLALMCSQFAIVLKAGMPIVRCVQLIAGQTMDKYLKKILLDVAEDVGTGYGLAQSFENKGGKMLPTTLIETIRSGEESGALEISFAKLETYYDKRSKTKSKVKSAMMYPAFLGVTAVIVIAIVLGVAMPTFIGMFESMGTELPAVTQLLISITDFFQAYWILIIAVVAAFVIAMKLIGRTEKGRIFFAKLMLKIPIIGKVTRMNGASQLANTMSTMLASGLTMVRATTITSRVMDNYHMGKQLATVVSGIEEGRRLGDCIERCDCFPDMLVEMTAVGEESGTLEDTLNTIGEYYDAETEVASQNALSALQPIITIVMGVIIGFVVIALYFPMFTMYG